MAIDARWVRDGEALFGFAPGIYDGPGGFDISLSSLSRLADLDVLLIAAAEDAPSLRVRFGTHPSAPAFGQRAARPRVGSGRAPGPLRASSMR